MSSDFLTSLANAVGDQFGLGENNNNNTLDIIEGGTVQKYGKLGDFAKKFDQSQERKYLQEGYLRSDPYNVFPKQLEILMQEPDVTVLVKKRAFSTLSENFRLDHLNSDEKLFYKASKILFQNKCQQIAALERLSKIARVTSETGEIAKQLFPLVLSLVDEIGNSINGSLDTSTETDILNDTFTSGFGKLQSVINQVRKVYNYTGNNIYTTWLSDTTNPFKSKLGQGSGVIEFTNVTNINTNCQLSIDPAAANFTIVDPYNMMKITPTDIERALSDATNYIYNHKIFQFGQQSSDDLAVANTKKLNDKRAQRGASTIQFIVDPDTVLGKRVRAIIENSGTEINFTYDSAFGLGGLAGGGVTISNESLKDGPEVGNEGLDTRGSGSSESSLFKRVIENIFNGLQLKNNSQSLTKQNSDLTNYARRKLRLHYLGKSVIQPMDQIHVYISSKSKIDNKILGGIQNSFTGLGFLQNINNISFDLKNQFDSLFNPSTNTSFQLEKSIIVGSDFPNWLWTILRSQFVNDTGGAHVYAGIVEDAVRSFNNGAHSVSVTAHSNTKYLTLGKVNFKPSLDVFNGPLYDPLTPFETSFDTLTGSSQKNAPKLLQENYDLLKNNFVRYTSGPNIGQKVTESNFSQNTDKEKETLGQFRDIYHCPNGFVYRWKEGIGTLVQFSDAFAIPNPNSTGNPPITKSPFAGQDVMNVISLAITGLPYNYATFVRAARQANGFSRDIQSGADSAHSFYRSLTSDLVKNNLLWGNFIPFKNLVMDEKNFERVLTAQNTITNTNSLINDKLQTIQDLNFTLQHLTGNNRTDNSTDAAIKNIKDSLQIQQAELAKLNGQVQDQLSNSQNQSLSVAGDDVSFELDDFLNNDSKNNESLSNPNIRKDLRRKLNFLSRRLSWQVRGNDDKNFLIVDDSYDRDYDLAAFEQALSGQLDLYNSDYSDVLEQVKNAANLLDLEVFCDTQGHIRVRPPQYNKIPSSVFYRLLQLKQQMGIQVFPKFLENLFVTQIQSLISKVEIIEDQIRLDAATLGKNSDFDVLLLIKAGNFSFISDENSGMISDFQKLVSQKDPDSAIATQSQTFLDKLNGQVAVNNIFNTNTKSQALNNLLSNGPTTITNSTRINDIIQRLTIKSGQQVTLDNFLIKASDGTVSASILSPRTTVDTLKVLNDISSNISQRQKLIKIAANSLKNAKEYLSLDDDTSNANKLLMPDISQNSNIPEVFASMLEDETYDDYGPGSGSRYIIKDYHIISYSIRETTPNYTAVEVKGQLNPFISNSSLPAEFNTFNAGGGGTGNALISAAAIDYDLWRMYGLRNTKSFSAPFLSQPDTQCAPYAAMILSRARKEIFQGDITISGNEFMQPGDVVYIESDDLLFYIESVSHRFVYGNSFQTTLRLTHGHAPGDYIPTTLDMIGKLIYNNKDSTDFVNYRQNSANNEQPIGSIILDNRKTEDVQNDILLGGNYGTQNISVINNILNTANTALALNQDSNNSFKAKIELRIFYNSKGTTTSINSQLNEAAHIVKSLLVGAIVPSDKSAINQSNLTLNDSDVSVLTVDTSGKSEFRSPSQQSVDMIRNISSTASSPFGNSTDFSSILFGYIIDCWITFTNESTSG